MVITIEKGWTSKVLKVFSSNSGAYMLFCFRLPTAKNKFIKLLILCPNFWSNLIIYKLYERRDHRSQTDLLKRNIMHNKMATTFWGI